MILEQRQTLRDISKLLEASLLDLHVLSRLLFALVVATFVSVQGRDQELGRIVFLSGLDERPKLQNNLELGLEMDVAAERRSSRLDVTHDSDDHVDKDDHDVHACDHEHNIEQDQLTLEFEHAEWRVVAVAEHEVVHVGERVPEVRIEDLVRQVALHCINLRVDLTKKFKK